MKLMTKELEKEFEKYPIGSQDGLGGNAKVIVKYFNPIGTGTWLITEGEKLENGDYEMFGYCHLGDDDMAELGYVMLSELEELQLPLKIERDLYMPKDCNLIQAMKITGITPPSYMMKKYQEQIYERVCKKYVPMSSNQILLNDEDKIIIALIKDESISKITLENYKEYAEEFDSFSTYKELFKSFEMNEGIEIDLEDNKENLYDENGKWTYGISKEDIKELQIFGERIDMSFLEKNNDNISYEI